jgi:hypothetical protein
MTGGEFLLQTLVYPNYFIKMMKKPKDDSNLILWTHISHFTRVKKNIHTHIKGHKAYIA